MSYKSQQVLRTKVPLKAVEGQIPPKTRVVVLGMDENGKVRVKVADPALLISLNAGKSIKLIASVGAFTTTLRGRPKKE